MKNKIKYLISAITFLITVIASGTSMAQPTVTINYNGSNLAPGPIDIPIVLNGTSIGIWQLNINYNRDVLVYTGRTDNVPAYFLYSVTPSYSNPLGGTNLKITFTPFPNVSYNYSNQTVVVLHFFYYGGNTNVEFINKSTSTSQSQGGYTFVATYPGSSNGGTINLNTTFYDGSASGPFATLYSVPAGGNWNDPATWSLTTGSSISAGFAPTGVVNTIIYETGLVTVNGAARTKDLKLKFNSKLTVPSGSTLYVTGNMSIKSNNLGTGSFIDDGTNTTVVGTTSVDRYMTGNWDGTWTPTTPPFIWHYISSPVSGGTINSFLGSLLNYWDEPGNIWQPMTLPVTNPLIVKKGYSTALTSNQIITYTGGTLNTGQQYISGLTNSNSSNSRGFNLVGNSYPSAITWDGSIYLANVDPPAYIWSGYNYVNPPILTTDPTPGIIPAGQGFFIHVSLGTTTGSITIPNSNRVHSTLPFAKNSSIQQLLLKIEGNMMDDITAIRLNSNSTTDFDVNYDAFKMWGINACPQIYTLTQNNEMSLNSLPEINSSTVIPVGLRVGANTMYTITATGMENFQTGTTIYLEDLLDGKVQNLNSNPVYEFMAAPGGDAHRFNLKFSTVSGLPALNSNQIRIYSFDQTIFVNIPMDLNGTIIVYDLLGKVVKTQPVQSNILNKINLNANGGYYLVKVLGDKTTVSGKVFIR